VPASVVKPAYCSLEGILQGLEVKRRGFQTQLLTLKARTWSTGAEGNTSKVNLPKIDVSKSWSLFHLQFQASAVLKDWTPGKICWQWAL